MVKKTLVGIGAAALIFSLAACGGDKKKADSKKKETQKTEKKEG